LSTLAVLEQRGGKLSPASLSAIAAAQKLGGSVTGFVAGEGVKSSAAAEAAKIKGIEKIVAVDNAAYEKVCGTRTQQWKRVRNFESSLYYYHRAYPKTTLPCSWTTSKAADIHM
jgi:electron transfer flavoprotein alpha subunit